MIQIYLRNRRGSRVTDLDLLAPGESLGQRMASSVRYGVRLVACMKTTGSGRRRRWSYRPVYVVG